MAEGRNDTPWQQGFVLSQDSAIKLGLVHPDARETIVVLITHDCDLLEGAEVEPEPVRARAVPTKKEVVAAKVAKPAKKLKSYQYRDPVKRRRYIRDKMREHRAKEKLAKKG